MVHHPPSHLASWPLGYLNGFALKATSAQAREAERAKEQQRRRKLAEDAAAMRALRAKEAEQAAAAAALAGAAMETARLEAEAAATLAEKRKCAHGLDPLSFSS